MNKPTNPCSEDVELGELYERLQMLCTVIEDCDSALVEIIGTGYSATLPMFQLSEALKGIQKDARRARSIGARLYVRTSLQ